MDTKKFSEHIEEMGNKFSELLKNSPAADLEKNIKAGMQGMFSRMDLVTREEFDAQAHLLESAQKRIQDLEARIARLESR